MSEEQDNDALERNDAEYERHGVTLEEFLSTPQRLDAVKLWARRRDVDTTVIENTLYWLELKGRVFRAKTEGVTRFARKGAVVEVVEERAPPPDRVDIHIEVAPAENPDRVLKRTRDAALAATRTKENVVKKTDWINTAEAAKLLGITNTRVTALARSGVIEGRKNGTGITSPMEYSRASIEKRLAGRAAPAVRPAKPKTSRAPKANTAAKTFDGKVVSINFGLIPNKEQPPLDESIRALAKVVDLGVLDKAAAFDALCRLVP